MLIRLAPQGFRRRRPLAQIRPLSSATNRPTVLVVAGPTAIGKSALCKSLTTALDGEVVSLDSVKVRSSVTALTCKIGLPNAKSPIFARQIYRGMDIGSNKSAERSSMHLIDVRSPSSAFSAFDYAQEARRAVTEIAGRGKLPLIVGGAGQYLSFLTGDSGTTAPPKDPVLYNRILSELERRGDWETTQAHIASIDPAYAASMSPNTWRRAARVLELHQRTGKPISAFRSTTSFLDDFDVRMFALRMTPRMDLLRLIDHRVEHMLYSGLVAEVVELLHSGDLRPDSPPAQSIGYRQIIDFLADRKFSRTSIRDLIYDIMAKSRQLAHSQYAWFKRIPHLHWVDVNRWDMLPHGNDRLLRLLTDYARMPREEFDAMVANPRWTLEQQQLQQPMPKKQETKFYRTYRPILHLYNDELPVRHGNPEVTILMNYLNSVRLPDALLHYQPSQKQPTQYVAPAF